MTFLFTDVEGSTRLLHEHGAGYVQLSGGMSDPRGAAVVRAAARHGLDVPATRELIALIEDSSRSARS